MKAKPVQLVKPCYQWLSLFQRLFFSYKITIIAPREELDLSISCANGGVHQVVSKSLNVLRRKYL